MTPQQIEVPTIATWLLSSKTPALKEARGASKLGQGTVLWEPISGSLVTSILTG